MSLDIVAIDLVGLALIAWLVWYFFLSRRAEEGEAVAAGGVQEIHVSVKGGYAPELITAKPGVPLRIHFHRQEDAPCSEEVVFPDFGVRRRLPAFATTVVELPARAEGSYGFACGMDMLHGTLVVGERAAAPAAVAAAPANEAKQLDPICGMRVDPARAAGQSERDGKTVYFCSLGCKARFDSEDGPRSHVPGTRIALGVRKPGAERPPSR
jgi:plastocyanin domain-containing protein